MPKKKRTKQKPLLYIGVDPGKSGAIVGLIGSRVYIYEMPGTPLGIVDCLRRLVEGCDVRRVECLLEWINPGFSGINKSSASKLFGNFAELRMALTAIGIPFEEVKPKAWQKHYSMKKTKGEKQANWKERLWERTKKEFPDLRIWTVPRTKGKQVQISDALLIAKFCKERQNGAQSTR